MNLDLEVLRELAPTDLTVQSQNRYELVHDTFQETELTQEERERLQRLYSHLLHFGSARSYEDLWSGISLEVMRKDVAELGTSIDDGSISQAKAFHDLRGGTIFHLTVMEPSMIETFMPVASIRTLAYDLAKFMRGLFRFLDPEKSHEEESGIQVHTMESYLKPWRDRVLAQNQRTVRVRVTNKFQGSITCRCVETSALDRTLFNLGNNATRFSSEPNIDLATFQSGDLTRWCLINSISEDQEKWLEDKLTNNGLALFRLGESRGSSGLGLESCTDILGQVFGLPDQQALVGSGYIGASVIDHRFCAWFHWPVYQPKDGDSLCDCGDR